METDPNLTPSQAAHRQAQHDKLLPGLGTVVSRGLVYLTVLLIIAAVAWMAVTKVDVMVEARGRITTQGEPVEISLPQAGTVVELPVKVGQPVRSGDVLFRLDSFEAEAEAKRLADAIAVLEARIEGHETRAADHAANATLIDDELANLEEQTRLASNFLERRKRLYERGSVSLEAVEQQKALVLELRAQIMQVERLQRETATAATTQKGLAVEQRAEKKVLTTRLEQARERVTRCTVTAPVDGVISALAVAHPDSALAPGETAATIIPAGSPLIVKVEIPNRSMRRIKEGSSVRVGLDAFPVEDYGFLGGHLASLEPDVNEAGNYQAWIALDGNVGTAINLRAGLAARVQILHERRSLLDYLLKSVSHMEKKGLVVGE